MSQAQQERDREELLRTRVADLPEEQRKQFYRCYTQQIKDPDSYVVLNYLFLAGLHHFYLGKMARGAFNLAIFALGIVIFFLQMPILGVAIILAVTVIELPALFRSQLIVLKHNNDLSEKILEQLKRTPC